MAACSWSAVSVSVSPWRCSSPIERLQRTGALQWSPRCTASFAFGTSCNRKWKGWQGNSVMFERRQRKSSVACAMEVPDFLPATWSKGQKPRPIGPSFDLTAEEATIRQLNALLDNDKPYPDHGIEVMYRFAGFDPFQRSRYFGPFFDLGQFERFRRIFHHSTYRVLLGHRERQILSSLYLNEHCFKQRVWIAGARPGEEEIFELTLVQRVGGNWDGYWLTDSLRHDGEGIKGGIAY